MTDTPNYNLLDLVKQLYRRRRFIIIITLITIAAGVAFWAAKSKKYEAQVVFVLKNPLYADRNFLYNNDTKFIDYFASEDDIDKFMLMAESDSVQGYIIKRMNLAETYKMDVSDPKKAQQLKRLFASNLKIVRNDKKSLTLSYYDKDPVIAANVANLTVAVLEKSLRSFYNEIRSSMYQSIDNKIQEEDSAINVLTDTLVVLREKYGIYDMISPSRYNVMQSGMKTNGKEGFARGLEVIQNYESVKDQLVSDKSRHISLVNQYTTGTKVNELPLTKVIKNAKPPLKKSGVGLLMTIVASGLAGFFFSIVYVLFMGFYRKLIS